MPEYPNYGNDIDFPFEDILQTSSIIFYHCAIEANFSLLYVSPNVGGILGFTSEEFKTNSSLWINQIHEADRDKVISTYNQILEKERYVIEFRIQHKEGHYIWLCDEVRLVNDDQGEPSRWWGRR